LLEELVIKVPAPFLGTPDVGFSARYPAQPVPAPLKDVPFIIEGPPRPMHRLQARLELFREKRRLVPDASDEAYTWTDLIPLSDEVFILAFRDESLLADAELESDAYVANLVRPLIFPFLKDCVRIGQLALSDNIELSVLRNARVMAELELRRPQIVVDNGSILLFDLKQD
jgi:hypothetical protein